ncbi:MAG: MBL fold metallo-hydrolase [Acidobacteriia bacterium]|nr:MBL fold metallo-hydrolase [Terriglobia bacterium]
MPCLRNAVLSLLALALAGTAGSVQRPASPGTPAAAAQGELSRLADGVFAQVVSPDSDAVSNSGVVVLDSGVLVFDTHFTPEAGEALLEKIKAASPRPVRYLVNSHFHPDHTHGNQAFPAVRQIIGSTNARRDMLQKDLPALNQAQAIAQSQVEQLSKEVGQEQDARKQEALRVQLNQRLAFMRRMSTLKILAPVVTLDDSLIIIDGGREVDLLCLGAGHTDGDVVLFLPQEKIAFLGDLFFNDALPNAEDANMLEWMKSLREALKLDAKTFVPGHGQVGTKSDVEEFLSYLEDLKALVEPAVTRGDTLERVIRDLRLPSKYASYSFQDFFPANLQKMYAELKAVQSSTQPQEGVKKQGLHP